MSMKAKTQESSVRDKVVRIYSMSGGRGISPTGVKNLANVLKVTPEEIRTIINKIESVASGGAKGL